MRLILVGGCFPVQHNIPAERLYYRTTLRVLAEAGVCATAAVGRYERFATGLAAAETAVGPSPLPADVLVFHLRAEPVLRASRLVYTYLDDAKRRRRSLTVLGRCPAAERHDVLAARPATPPSPPPPPGPLRDLLVAANYRLGRAVGNEAAALRAYARLVVAVEALARERSVRLLFVGPVSRPCRASEDALSGRVEQAFAAPLASRGTVYLPVLGRADEHGQDLFFPNGIHVSQAGHDRIGRRIAERILLVE